MSKPDKAALADRIEQHLRYLDETSFSWGILTEAAAALRSDGMREALEQLVGRLDVVHADTRLFSIELNNARAALAAPQAKDKP